MLQVSTIIPVYNGAAYVGEAIESALSQECVDSEVIVVDDGSTDGTWQILEGFGDAIRAVRQENAGHIAARRRAAGLARGQWLAFLDADDKWLPDKLARQLALADADVAMVYSERASFGDCGHVSQRQSECEQLWEGDIFERLLLGNVVTVSSVVIRKDWYERLGGFDSAPYGCEDWDLWLRCSAAGGRVRVCREPLTLYRWRADAMSKNLERMQSGRLAVIRRALDSPRGQRVRWSLAARAWASTWETAGWYAANARNPKAALWYLRSICCWPCRMAVYRQLVKYCFQSVCRRPQRSGQRIQEL